MTLSNERKCLKLSLFILIRRICKVVGPTPYENWNDLLSLRASLLDLNLLLTYSLNYAKYRNEAGPIPEYFELIN